MHRILQCSCKLYRITRTALPLQSQLHFCTRPTSLIIFLCYVSCFRQAELKRRGLPVHSIGFAITEMQILTHRTSLSMQVTQPQENPPMLGLLCLQTMILHWAWLCELLGGNQGRSSELGRLIPDQKNPHVFSIPDRALWNSRNAFLSFLFLLDGWPINSQDRAETTTTSRSTTTSSTPPQIKSSLFVLS